jgi:crotonobetainyl-CoA:carnitine CoA-transferase CaiB-like acyl-CoA transferase
VDFSMIEAMLWTLAKPLLATQLGAPPRPRGYASDHFAPHGVFKCAGDDAWLSVTVGSDAEWRALCGIVPALRDTAACTYPARMARRDAIDAALEAWAKSQPARASAKALSQAGIAAAEVATSVDLVRCDHLRARGFWDAHGDGVLPGLPWRASFGRAMGLAPGLGADTGNVLREILAADAATRLGAG